MRVFRTQKPERQEIKGNWAFESSDDGSILYYPHGWGRGYLVPSEEKKREIENSLSVWLARRRAIFWFTRRICLPAMIPMFAGVLIIGIPSLRNSFPETPLLIVFTLGPFLLLVGCLLVLLSGVALRFVAEVAKADLEHSEYHRPLRDRWRRRAIECRWRGFLYAAAFDGFTLFITVWILQRWREGFCRRVGDRISC